MCVCVLPRRGPTCKADITFPCVYTRCRIYSNARPIVYIEYIIISLIKHSFFFLFHTTAQSRSVCNNFCSSQACRIEGEHLKIHKTWIFIVINAQQTVLLFIDKHYDVMVTLRASEIRLECGITKREREKNNKTVKKKKNEGSCIPCSLRAASVTIITHGNATDARAGLSLSRSTLYSLDSKSFSGKFNSRTERCNDDFQVTRYKATVPFEPSLPPTS